MKRLLALATVAVALVTVSSASATDLPTPGTTTTTVCVFDPHGDPAVTSCNSVTTTIIFEGCFTDPEIGPYLLFEEDVIASVRSYRGDALIAGVQSGDAVNGFYTQVRPHAKLIYDSGGHASGVGLMFPVASC
jgi:hypothetical protein